MVLSLFFSSCSAYPGRQYLCPGDIVNMMGGNVWGHCCFSTLKAWSVSLKSDIQYWIANSGYPISHVCYPMLAIQYRISIIGHSILDIQYCMSNIGYPISDIQYRISHMGYPSSDIQHWTPNTGNLISEV